jgi:hypothetical protein
MCSRRFLIGVWHLEKCSLLALQDEALFGLAFHTILSSLCTPMSWQGAKGLLLIQSVVCCNEAGVGSFKCNNLKLLVVRVLCGQPLSERAQIYIQNGEDYVS